jgi:hypothetical protein
MIGLRDLSCLQLKLYVQIEFNTWPKCHGCISVQTGSDQHNCKEMSLAQSLEYASMPEKILR